MGTLAQHMSRMNIYRLLVNESIRRQRKTSHLPARILYMRTLAQHMHEHVSIVNESIYHEGKIK